MKLGRYTLVEKIGEGGCGVVWRARQREPVQRDVALKVIKLGMDTREVIARFERDYLEQAIASTRGNVSLAAQHAGKERRAFGKLLKKYGIDRNRFLA